MNKAKKIPRKILEALQERDWLIALHASPDGDAVGSGLGLAELVRLLGRRSLLVCADPPPKKYCFLSGADAISGEVPQWPGWGLLCVDAADLERLGDLKPLVAGFSPVLNIDHHVSNRCFGDLNWVEPVSAAGELVARLFDEAGFDLSLVAEALYVAISTDSGSFRYSSTTPATHRIAARLLEAGVEPGRINSLIYDSMPLSTLCLHTRVLSGVKRVGTAAYATVTRAVLRECGAQESETEGIVEKIRAIKGVEVAFLLRETAKDQIKASLRSKGAVDVNRLAARFGGGGHAQAAGCTFPGSLEEAEKMLLQALADT
ncbi:MAG TPA: bifunctional oligoribonuclease/PAP phosphatase NrnA [Chroococcales cyanobacterium]|jgi:phosphoesterase RecJ-like protein